MSSVPGTPVMGVTPADLGQLIVDGKFHPFREHSILPMVRLLKKMAAGCTIVVLERRYSSDPAQGQSALGWAFSAGETVFDQFRRELYIVGEDAYVRWIAIGALPGEAYLVGTNTVSFRNSSLTGSVYQIYFVPQLSTAPAPSIAA
jgi:hypothetical protein